MRDKDVLAILETLEPVLAQIVVTRNASERSLPVGELAELAREVFGDERVVEAKRLDDAIDKALGLAEEAVPAGTSGGAGVIVTGSVVTAGEARTLLVRRMPERLSERQESEVIGGFGVPDAEDDVVADADADLIGPGRFTAADGFDEAADFGHGRDDASDDDEDEEDGL